MKQKATQSSKDFCLVQLNLNYWKEKVVFCCFVVVLLHGKPFVFPYFIHHMLQTECWRWLLQAPKAESMTEPSFITLMFCESNSPKELENQTPTSGLILGLKPSFLMTLIIRGLFWCTWTINLVVLLQGMMHWAPLLTRYFATAGIYQWWTSPFSFLPAADLLGWSLCSDDHPFWVWFCECLFLFKTKLLLPLQPAHVQRTEDWM